MNEADGGDFDDDTPRAASFDAEATRKLLGLSEAQYQFARARLRGANQTQAAAAAGYKGTSNQLRSAGSRVSRARRVQRFLELAALEGGGVADQAMDRDERRRLLSRIARGQDSNAAIRASEVLHRMDEADREADQGRHKDREPASILMEIAAINLELAAELAAAERIPFDPGSPELRARAERHCAKVAFDWIRDHAEQAREIAVSFLHAENYTPARAAGFTIVKGGIA